MKYDLIYNIPEATLYQATFRYTFPSLTVQFPGTHGKAEKKESNTVKNNRQARQILGMERWISHLRKIIIRDKVEVVYKRHLSRRQKQRVRQQKAGSQKTTFR